MLNAKNLAVGIGNAEMDYISFGRGEKPLVMLPGLGDALRTVKGTALTLAMMYKIFAKSFRVFVFSRKNELPEGYSIRDMAEDQARAMNTLGISDACVMGVSQGGMIAMHLAAEHPELVGKLVLADTAAKCGDTMRSVLENWLKLAKADDFKGLFIDTAEKTYSEKKLKAYRPAYALLAAGSRPKSLDRFVIQASACLCHDAVAELGSIKCPALVIGGDADRIVGSDASRELAAGIACSELEICEGFGHGAFEEAPGFNARVLRFLEG